MKNNNRHRILIDYPRVRETIGSPEYTFRIGTREQGLVEVSIDGGPWRACRPSVGYWWYDWQRDKAGTHKLVARVRTPEGEVKTCARSFAASR